MKVLRSDNGTNFVHAERELRQSIEKWNNQKIQDHLSQQGIKWVFNPPTGSHHGRVWERLIRSIRKILNATVREQVLDEECLQTIFCEAEAITNSRPIKAASSDINDLCDKDTLATTAGEAAMTHNSSAPTYLINPSYRSSLLLPLSE